MTDKARIGILFVLAGMLFISVNDMLVKALSGGYPLHQIVFFRSVVGLAFGLVLVQVGGGLGQLRHQRFGWQIVRGLLIVVANLSFFAAIAVLPLADATALFFVAPLLITLLSVPILGERIGPVRIAAVLVGLCGVIIMQRPWAGSALLEVDRFVLMLPLVAAFSYALAQVMTRFLGRSARASVLAVNIQAIFVVVSVAFYLAAGDGRYADGLQDPSLVFLLRAWVWPEGGDWWVLCALGLNAAGLSYCLSEAYRSADAAVIAPYEYVGLPLAVFWGIVIFGDVPVWEVWLGMALIVSAGLVVFLRARQ